MKSEKEILNSNKIFFRKIARLYDKKPLSYLLDIIIVKTLKNTEIKENFKILDVGCGTGKLLEHLENRNINLDLYGIDISSEMLNHARKRLKKSKLKIGSSEKIRYPKKFDLILVTEAFHHFASQKKAVSNLYKNLKKGGKLVITDIDLGRFFNFLFHAFEPGNSKMNSKKDFLDLFKDNNFKNIKQKRLGLIAIMTSGIK